MSDYSYDTGSCQGLKAAIEDLLKKVKEIVARRELLQWIIGHFGTLVAPWQFPPLASNPPSQEDIDNWIETVVNDDECPCHEALLEIE